MSVKEHIEQRLLEALHPERMLLLNESHRHSVPPGSETHFNLVIVSQAFEGRSLLERHRQVYAVLGESLRSGVHALTMKTLTPAEWEAAGGDVTNPAPACRGGSKPRPPTA
jgi:BolA protein